MIWGSAPIAPANLALIARKSNHRDSLRTRLLLWLTPMVLTLGLIFGLLVAGRLGDLLATSQGWHSLFTTWRVVSDPQVAREVMLAVLEVLAGVFAISITVVAIIVQLSATRYTSRVVDLFLADPFNVVIFFVYVVPLIFGFWLANSLGGGNEAPVSTLAFFALSTLAIILVIPYFKYVFYFLQPKHILDNITGSVKESLGKAITQPGRIAGIQDEVSNSIRQLNDIALSSLAQSDIVLALQCVDSINQVAVDYLEKKARLPPEWFRIAPNHIVGLSEEVWREIVERHTWIEMEIFKQYEITFTTSLRKVRDVNSQVARSLRGIAQAALEHDRGETLDLFIKGMNTLIMYALSERDIRSAVNVLYQYRLLGEALTDRPVLVERIAGHLSYYGRNSRQRRIFFVMEVVAYDLRTMIEHVHARDVQGIESLVAIFLGLDNANDHQDSDGSPSGLRKSQALLAAFLIRENRLDLAGRIFKAMSNDPPEFLSQLREELFANQSREFWEIEDRGVSFYYVEELHRESVGKFFSWLLGENPLPIQISQSA